MSCWQPHYMQFCKQIFTVLFSRKMELEVFLLHPVTLTEPILAASGLVIHLCPCLAVMLFAEALLSCQ